MNFQLPFSQVGVVNILEPWISISYEQILIYLNHESSKNLVGISPQSMINTKLFEFLVSRFVWSTFWMPQLVSAFFKELNADTCKSREQESISLSQMLLDLETFSGKRIISKLLQGESNSRERMIGCFERARKSMHIEWLEVSNLWFLKYGF